MKCPTCEDAKEDCCCLCGCAIKEGERDLQPNPYASEIYGCDDMHLMCDNCCYESAEDI